MIRLKMCIDYRMDDANLKVTKIGWLAGWLVGWLVGL